MQEQVREEIQRHIASMPVRPTFSVIIDLERGCTGLEDTLRSLEKQVYPPLEVCVLRGEGVPGQVALLQTTGGRLLSDKSLEGIRGSHCVFVDAGNLLDTYALYEFASAINASPAAEVIYADEDVIDRRGRHVEPFFKPEWSPDYLEVFNYIEFPSCYQSGLARTAYHHRCLYDLAIRITESARNVIHIPKVLGHRRQAGWATSVSPATAAAATRALQGRLARTGRRGSVAPHATHRGCYVVSPLLIEQPRVSAIIPTAGLTIRVGERVVDLLTNLVVQIRERSTYQNIEIVVVDNGTLTESQSATLRERGCLSVSYLEQGPNIARKINLGAAEASGKYFLIVNDDIEILTPDWIERMLGSFLKPDVGVVGCRLLYPDQTIQHAGVVFVQGHPYHVRRQMAGGEAGYYFSSCASRNYLAVTGACMMTPRDVFFDVGGYDESFPLNYNDIDYCLKVRQRGRRVVYDGGVALTHLESVSRPPGGEVVDVEVFARRWAAEIVADPYYNNRVFNLSEPAFVPQLNPRTV